MKIVALILRLLLGLMFLVFGLNGFLQFISAPLPAGPAGTYITVLNSTHYIYLVSGTQAIAGILLLINRYVPLALAILAPVIANIIVFHVTMLMQGSQMAFVTAAMWGFLTWRYRAHFAGLFVQKAD
jgi:uncharacterized membrane protein YphA (DoxX/SURF4 family)